MTGGLVWIVAAMICAGLVEIGIRLPFASAIAGMATSGRKAARVAASRRISDHWKEKAMGAYARATFGHTIALAAMIVGLLGGAALFIVGLEAAGVAGLAAFMTGPAGVAFTLVFACLYAWVRLRRWGDVRV